MSDSLRPHESQHTRPPCPSPTPGVTQTHVHRVGDAIQPSRPLSSPSPPALNLFQHQCLFKWVSSLQKSGQSIGDNECHKESKQYNWLKTFNLYFFKTLNLYFLKNISFLNTRSLKWYSQPFISPKKIYSVFFILCIIQGNQKYPKFWGCFSLYINPS